MLFTATLERYLAKFGDSVHSDEDGMRSEGSWWSSEPPHLNAAELAHTRASLAVLGEPGIGKSTVIAKLVQADPDVNVVRLDEATDVGLLDELLAPTSRPWATNEQRTLVLDGLDECPLPPKVLLRRVLASMPTEEDLRVVVGCRAADWVPEFGEQITARLASFEVLELLPLSREDVRRAAESRGVDPLAFVDAVRAVGAGPLASLPLTLDLLLRLFDVEGALPEVPAHLFERGLKLLAGEPDPLRTEIGPPRSGAQRLAVASRIAAQLLLCSRSAVTREKDPAASDLDHGQISGGLEMLPSGEFEVTTTLVNDALGSGLFASRGPNRFALTHASFAAYLTARFLIAHGVPEHQLRALLTRSSTLGHVSVPTRLRETAAWLVALDPKQNFWLVELDPEVFVAHGALVTDDLVRERLVAWLLDAPLERLGHWRKWRLSHSGLADQLRPALQAPTRGDAGQDLGNSVSRRAHIALRVARGSDVQGLGDEVAQLVLAPNLNAVVRSAAAHALVDLDSSLAAEAFGEVLDEIQAHPERDPNDDLRGIGLDTCWPDRLCPKDLLGALSVPKNNSYIGPYQVFINSLPSRLSPEHALELVVLMAANAALPNGGECSEGQWTDDEDPPHEGLLLSGNRRSKTLTRAVLERALLSSRLEEFATEAGWLIAQCVKKAGGCDLPDRFARPHSAGSLEPEKVRRHVAVEAMRFLNPKRAIFLYLRSRVRGADSAPMYSTLIGGDDLDWLFSLGDGPHHLHAARLLRVVFDPADLDHHGIVWRHRESSLYDTSVGHWFRSVELGSNEAAELKEDHLNSFVEPVWDGAEMHPVLLAESWEKCKGGELLAFGELCWRLRTDPDTGQASYLGSERSSWPSRELLAASDDELGEVALAYLTNSKSPEAGQLGDPTRLTAEVSNWYSVFCLIAQIGSARGLLGKIPMEVWSTSSKIIVQCASWGPDEGFDAVVIKALASRAPSAFVQAYVLHLDAMASSAKPLPDPILLAPFWDRDIADRLDLLLVKLISLVGKWLAQASVLEAANSQQGASELRNNVREARNSVLTIGTLLCLQEHEPSVQRLHRATAMDGNESSPAIRTIAGRALCIAGKLSWESFFGHMQADQKFRRSAICDMTRRDSGWPLASLEDGELAALWLCMDDEWSSATDAFSSGAVSSDQLVRDWRNVVLSTLADRATPASLAALDSIGAVRPEDYRVRMALNESENRQRDESWHGPSIDEFTALLGDPRRTVVQDDDDLFRVVLAALERLPEKIKTIGQLLWNETRPAGGAKPMVWRPKFEPDVSAFLTDYLQQELGNGVVVNREVLVKQTTSKGHGLSVDVLASSSDAGGLLERMPRCPIEVKGSWNAKLFEDLKDQLVGDYLPALEAVRGVYVCAWFPVEMWTDLDDSRRTVAASRSREDVASTLQSTARGLSAAGQVEVSAVVLDIPRPEPSRRAASR